MGSKDTMAISDKFIVNTYKRQPLVIVKGKRSYLWDADGNKYIDFTSGISVTNLGHSYPSICKLVQREVTKLIHTSNIFYTESSTVLAQRLVEHIGSGSVFFSNSGAESNEGAIKIARFVSSKTNPDKIEIISFKDSFHGRTTGALALTGQPVFKNGFEPLLPGVKFANYNNIKSVEKLINKKKTAAIIVEPIQGESGIIVPAPDFILELSKLAKKNNLILIVDEVQTGFGRTGRLFAYEHAGIKPDIVTMAKAIANGFPMGAIWCKSSIAKELKPGSHASTFGGGPLVSKVALEVMKNINNEKFLEDVKNKGIYMMLKLNGMKSKFPALIKEVRGVGMMIAVELHFDSAEIVSSARSDGLLLLGKNNTIKLLPPLTIARADMDRALSILGKIFSSK